MKRPISNFYNNSNSTDFFENVSYKTEILQNNSWQISQKCMLQEFKIVLIRETRWLQNLSRSWPFLSLPSFCFILSFVGFNFSSRYCVSGAGYSWILQKIPVEFPTEISDHKSTWLWIFETSKPGILCMLNGLKKKHFRLNQNKWIVHKLIIDHGIYMFNYTTVRVEEVRFIFLLIS